MFYEAVRNMDTKPEINWPSAPHYIRAKKIPAGCEVHIPVLKDNHLIIGTTGYGKTTVTRKIVDAALDSGKNQFCVFLETKKDFRDYIRPEDKVIAHSEQIGKYSFFRWNMIAECRQAREPDYVLDAVTDLLFADLLADSKNKFFAEGARNIFRGYIKTILHCYSNCPGNQKVIDGMKYMSYMQMIKHLLQYKPNRSIVRDYFGYDISRPGNYVMPKRTGDLMAFLSNVLDKFSGTFYSASGTDTIHDYLKGKYGHRLFLIYDYSKRASSNTFFRFFLQRIVEECLAQNADLSKHVLLVLDEAPVLEGDFGLMQAATLGRGNNLQVILASQSIEKLYCIAPEVNGEHITRAGMAGFPTIIAFHPGDGETIELLQKLYGTVRKQVFTMPVSRYDRPQSQYVTEPQVSDEEFASLGVGECYIKIKDAPPVRVKIRND